MNIALDRSIVLKGIEYPLYVHFSTEKTLMNETLVGKIPIPEGYPKTKLTDKITDFGEIVISKPYGVNELSGEHLVLVVNKGFYRDLALPEELLPFKGVGKLILCLGLRVSLLKFSNLTESAYVSFYASGERCDEQYVPRIYHDMDPIELINETCSKNTYAAEFILDHFNIRIPKVVNIEVVKKLYNSNPHLFDKHLLKLIACRIIENEKLIEYYKSLGFKLQGYSSATMAFMSGTLKNILKKC
jgi:hypothetical protein